MLKLMRFFNGYLTATFVWLLTLSPVLAQAGLPPGAQAALQAGNLAASEALATYEAHFLDKPLWREAIRKGAEARDLAPNHPAPYRFLAEVYGNVSFYEPAWEAWKLYRARGGVLDARVRQELVEVGDWLGYNSYASGDYGGAIQYYEVVTELEPANEEALLNLGLSYLQLADRAAALPVFERLVDINPADPNYRSYLARAEDGLDFGEDATAIFHKGIELYYSGSADLAWLEFSKAARANPDYRDAFVWAGRTALEMRQPADAISYWERAVELDPADEGAQYFLNVARQQAEWGIEAYTLFEEGYGAYQQGDLNLARSKFMSAAQASAEYAQAWGWLGRVAFETGAFSEAYRAYERAAQLEPGEQAYSYFYQQAARQAGLEPTLGVGAAAQAAQPQTAQPQRAQTPPAQPQAAPQPAPSPEAAPPPAPAQEAAEPATQEAAEPAAPEASALETPAPALSAPQTEAAAPEPVPQPEIEVRVPAPNATGGPPLELLSATYSRDERSVDIEGAIAFFEPSQSLRRDLANPVNYAGGTLHLQLTVADAPGNAAMQVQVCLIPSDVSVKPACGSGAVVTGAGSYEFRQPLSTFSRHGEVDWSTGLSGLMLILRDQNGVPLDRDFALEGGNLSAYYPVRLEVSAVLVPVGGTFAGWP